MFAQAQQQSLGGNATAAKLSDASDCTSLCVSVCVCVCVCVCVYVCVCLSMHTTHAHIHTLTVQLIDYITPYYATKRLR